MHQQGEQRTESEPEPSSDNIVVQLRHPRFNQQILPTDILCEENITLKSLPELPADINIHIGDSLLINHGIIVADRPMFHSAKNIFPLGYMYQHKFHCIKHPTEQHDYLCEILDSGKQPVFRVTSCFL